MSQGGLATPLQVDGVPMIALDNAVGDDVAGLKSWVQGTTTAPSEPRLWAMRAFLKPSVDPATVSTDPVQSQGVRKLRFVGPFSFFALTRRRMGGANPHRASFSDVTVPTMTTGAAGTIAFTVRNDGWETWRTSSPNAYCIGVNLAADPPAPRGTLPQDSNGYPLRVTPPSDVAPGDTVTATADLPAQSQARRYMVQLDVVEEGIAWFESRGDIPAQLDVIRKAPARPESSVVGARVPLVARRLLPSFGALVTLFERAHPLFG